MRDDRIQGILFSSSQRIDLSPKSQQRHFFEKLRTTGKNGKGKASALISDIIHPSNGRVSRRVLREHDKKVASIQKRLKIRF